MNEIQINKTIRRIPQSLKFMNIVTFVESIKSIKLIKIHKNLKNQILKLKQSWHFNSLSILES